jgi:hypothetical protein
MYCKTGHHNQSSPVQINICYIYCLYALNTYLCLYVQYYWLSRISRLSPAQLVRLQGRGGGIAGGAEDCRQYLGTVLRRDQYYCIACCRSTLALTVYCTVRCDSTRSSPAQYSTLTNARFAPVAIPGDLFPGSIALGPFRQNHLAFLGLRYSLAGSMQGVST